MDIRTPLAVSRSARVEIGQDGILHILAGPITLHLNRPVCEELSATLTRALQHLEALDGAQRPALQLVPRASTLGGAQGDDPGVKRDRNPTES